MTDNIDDEKLKQKGQTEMKHRILELYFNPWMTKLSTVNRKLVFVDGFAGPGVYPDGWTGSPLRVMNIADTVLSEYDGVDERLDEFECIFVENNADNHEELERNVKNHEQEVDDRITTKCVDADFKDWADNYIQEQKNRYTYPTLVFIDPFGFGEDIPFELLSELFQLKDQSYELLITFMAGKMAQYWEVPNHQKGITTTLDMDDWIDYLDEDMGKDEVAKTFTHLYQRQWKEQAGANYTMPFEMVEEGKSQICYHLIHITNHLDGLKVMKKTMFSAGADDQYAYLGPDHSGYEDEQLKFTEFGESTNVDTQIEDFADELHASYAGETITFQELLEETLDQNVFLPTHYRDAFQVLEEVNKLEVDYQRSADTELIRGYKPEDKLNFVEPTTLGQFG